MSRVGKSKANSANSECKYSTNSLCSNKSVKFNLPTSSNNATGPSEDAKKLDLCEQKKFYSSNSWATFATGPQGNNPNYFICQNFCANCGMCPFTNLPINSAAAAAGQNNPALGQNNAAFGQNNAAFYNHPNVQYALIQAQNFFNYQIQQTSTTTLMSQQQPESDQGKIQLSKIIAWFSFRI